MLGRHSREISCREGRAPHSTSQEPHLESAFPFLLKLTHYAFLSRMLFLEEKSSLVLSCHLMNRSKRVVGERRAIRLEQEGAGKPLRLWLGTGIPVWCTMWDCFTHPGEGGFPSFLLFTPEEELQHCPLFPLATPRHGAVQTLASM